MRLRDSIRLPERFNQDQFLSPYPQKPLREPRTPRTVGYVDFNPNLPPATFPTLDKACPARQASDAQDHDGDNHSRVSGYKRPCERTYDNSKVQRRRGEDGKTELSSEHIECMVASNGELNPIFMRNMAIMAAADEEPSIYRDMEDSDIDEDMVDVSNAEGEEEPSSASVTRTLKWHDFSTQMKVEIFDNMLQNYNSSTVCHLLELTTEEGDQIQQDILQRDIQVEQEDAQLEAMRAKQLRALLRIDNTARGHNRVPHQGVFSRISRQHSGKLQDMCEPRLLLSDASEVLEARKFLHSRGLDSRFAGEWSNGVSSLQDPASYDIAESLEAAFNADARIAATFSEDDMLFGDINVDVPELTTSCRSSIADTVGGPYSTSIGYKGDPTHGRQNEQDNVCHSPREDGMVRLRVGQEKAAQISDHGLEYIKPEWTFNQLPSDRLCSEKPPSRREQTHGPSIRKRKTHKPRQGYFNPPHIHEAQTETRRFVARGANKSSNNVKQRRRKCPLSGAKVNLEFDSLVLASPGKSIVADKPRLSLCRRE
ncbi:hypothetical protein BO70DRAFT_397771 [Aspergillus heteromorphus CBS 117.55]|uniref:Uncharacterized protein n=1 Tax=Aspergillus heteromorphus CBS 117.55 TaxID=1448321 RepID=A0A317VUE9_9EURO|nr:uncharacterized protein BO70DRAFT_397771 [Aspergillus heteromorphus CBS 117.55]PWY77485.1 hypothetical protein BO70DRAFT_397771 [Aspergillus heteromorphus CBS 117.55]